jgi:hypothetical protein
MITKSPNLNISAFVSSLFRGLEKSGQTRLLCVFVEMFRSLRCETISQKVLRRALIYNVHGLVFTTRHEDELF